MSVRTIDVVREDLQHEKGKLDTLLKTKKQNSAQVKRQAEIVKVLNLELKNLLGLIPESELQKAKKKLQKGGCGCG